MDKKVNIEEIAKKGSVIYEKVKKNHEPQHNGKFLAVDVDTEDIFTGDSTSDVLQLARAKYPGKVFYVVKIGFSAAEILSNLTRIQHA